MYNPANDYYFQNAQQIMTRQPYPQQNYGQQLLPFPPQQPQTPQISCRYVSNIEEAKAVMIDPLSTNVFLDTGSGKLYVKKMSNNGLSEFYTYVVEETKTERNPLNEINTRLSNIENYLGRIRNDKSVPVNEQSEPISQPAVAESYEPNGTAESAGFPKNARNDKWKK